MLKAPVTSVQFFCSHDGEGIRTTVFFCGCPLECVWCHNPECSKLFYKCQSGGSPISIEWMTPIQLFDQIKKDIPFYIDGGGVTCSGGEPLLHIDFLIEFLQLCKTNEIKTAIETSLYAPFSEIERLLPFVDTWIVDIKFIDEKKHKKYTGKENSIILESFDLLCKNADNVWAREIAVPQIHTEEDFERFSAFIKQYNAIKNVELIPFHTLGKEKYQLLNETCPYSNYNDADDGWINKMKKIPKEYDLPVDKY